jgi:ketosteroid isomerase-like protein
VPAHACCSSLAGISRSAIDTLACMGRVHAEAIARMTTDDPWAGDLRGRVAAACGPLAKATGSLRDAGDQVVEVIRLSARGKGSGVPLDRLDAMVWSLRDGKAVRLDYFGSRTEALEAVGLSS